MGFFDFLSGSDEAEAAAAQNKAQLASYGIDTSRLYDQYGNLAQSALTTGKDASLGALGTGLTSQIDAYTKSLGAATAAGQAGVAGYDPLRGAVDAYKPAVDTYYSALGVGDPALAQKAFTTAPGYQFQQDEAARALLANASRTGAAGSGNTLQALSDRSQDIANTSYNDWLNRIGAFVPLQQQGYTALGAGLSGANRTLADIYSSGGQQIGGAYGTNAAQQAGIQTGYGSDIANVLGNKTAGQTQTLKDITTGNLAANNQVAQAGQQDAANLWGLIGAGTKAAGSYFGKPA